MENNIDFIYNILHNQEKEILNKEDYMKSKLSIVFYVIAAISLIAFVLSAYSTTVYLMALAESGQLSLAESFVDVIVTYLSNGFAYFIYSVMLFGMGYMIRKIG